MYTLSTLFSRDLLKSYCFLFFAALAIRSATFYWYIQEKERYHQADSLDYHISTLGIATGNGMFHIGTKKPIFWRTPGYPWYLSHFYKWHGLRNGAFDANKNAQKAAIWVQIILCSLMPILVFMLAHFLTKSTTVSWVAGIITVFHLGMVLGSCYLLTDALATLFFLLFLLFFFAVFRINGESEKPLSLWYIVAAALMLAVYTWLRPNGQWFGLIIAASFLISHGSWAQKITRALLFGFLFHASLAPWCIRNYRLTNHYFFCPMSGPYLLSFSAPKIVRRLTKKPLGECIQSLCIQARQETAHQEQLLALRDKTKYIVHELTCVPFATPWILKYPHYFLADWLKEVCKTTFDLYSSQLVAFANNTYTFDPLEEFLSEKLQLCFYKQPMHWFMRLIVYLEALFYLLLWIGIVGGIYNIIRPAILCYRARRSLPEYWYTLALTWAKSLFLFGIIVAMTGGFGYARLRMSVEPLIIIMSLTWWVYIVQQRIRPYVKGAFNRGLSVRPVA